MLDGGNVFQTLAISILANIIDAAIIIVHQHELALVGPLFHLGLLFEREIDRSIALC